MTDCKTAMIFYFTWLFFNRVAVCPRLKVDRNKPFYEYGTFFINGRYTVLIIGLSVAEPHHFYADLGNKFVASAADITVMYSKTKYFKWIKFYDAIITSGSLQYTI
jgi:hypothetical protein